MIRARRGKEARTIPRAGLPKTEALRCSVQVHSNPDPGLYNFT